MDDGGLFIAYEYTGEILLVGINYDKETKGHPYRIEVLRNTE